MESWKVLEPSTMSKRGVNTLECITLRKSKAPANKSQLKFSVGDPTHDGNLVAPPSAVDALVRCVEGNKCNGYPQMTGRPDAREAVAQYWGKNFAPQQSAHCKGENVVFGCGVSDVFIVSLTSLCDEGDNILIPKPCFSFYDFACELYSVEARHYLCNHEKDWEIDFDHLRSLVDGRTKAILMNNPSNPCGSNFSRQHIADLIRVCEELHLPLIADEIYAGLVFSGETFTSVADFDTPVPLFVVSGLSKRFNVPGYRFGWVVVVDRDGYGAKLLKGVRKLATRTLMPNSLLQHAVVSALEETPQSFFEDCANRMEAGAMVLYNGLKDCPGLKLVRPRGSMFMSVVLAFEELDCSVRSDVEFSRRLAEEENVHVFPGEPFNMPGALRITVSRSLPMLHEAVQRIQSFCERHRRA